MQVVWEYRNLESGSGNGVEVHIGEASAKVRDDFHRPFSDPLAFIEGFRWREIEGILLAEPDNPTFVFLDTKLTRLSKTLTTDIQFSILRFMTDKTLQKEMFMTVFHGFTFWTNG